MKNINTLHKKIMEVLESNDMCCMDEESDREWLCDALVRALK